MMKPIARLGLIVPAGTTAAEVHVPRDVPAGVCVHTMRLRMTGQWSRPLSELAAAISQAVPACPGESLA
jgi:maleate cis-trans isomerase